MEFPAADFLETIRESPIIRSASSEGAFDDRDLGVVDPESFPDVYKPANIEGYQEFYNSISPRMVKGHFQFPNRQKPIHNSNAEQDVLLSDAVRFRLERLRLQKVLPRKPSMLMGEASQAEKAYRIRELKKIKYCERRIDERIEELMEGLLRCHELCGVGLEGSKAQLEENVIRLPWYGS